jgi:hypothetical protein
MLKAPCRILRPIYFSPVVCKNNDLDEFMALFVPDNVPVGPSIRQEAPGGPICIVSLAGEAPSNHKADLLS